MNAATATVAALPMYDLPEARDWTDAWWAGLAGHLRAAGLTDVPDDLTRPVGDMESHWTAPTLLLSQTCGYPLTHGLSGRVAYVATPRHAAPGCDGADYRSHIVVRADDGRGALAAFRGGRVAYNARDSQSGLHALRAAIADLPGEAETAAPFFADALATGGHRESLAAVRAGRADICAVDCVSFALLERYAPDAVAGLRALAETPPAPGLPLITASSADADRIDRLRAGLAGAFADEALAEVRAALLIAGLSILDPTAYDAIRRMESRTGKLLGQRLF